MTIDKHKVSEWIEKTCILILILGLLGMLAKHILILGMIKPQVNYYENKKIAIQNVIDELGSIEPRKSIIDRSLIEIENKNDIEINENMSYIEKEFKTIINMYNSLSITRNDATVKLYEMVDYCDKEIKELNDKLSKSEDGFIY